MTARSFVALDEPLIEEIGVERHRTSYRALLHFNEYLWAENREKAFKLFCYDYIPTKNWDVDIEDWMMKLEQSHVLPIDHLQVLRCFLKCYDDVPTHKMRCRIRHFQYELRLVSNDVFIHSATFLKTEKSSKSRKVHTSSLEALFIAEFVMKITRMCDQNKLATRTNKIVGPFSLEALVITEFLMKIRGICDQNKLATTESSQNFYALIT